MQMCSGLRFFTILDFNQKGREGGQCELEREKEDVGKSTKSKSSLVIQILYHMDYKHTCTLCKVIKEGTGIVTDL